MCEILIFGLFTVCGALTGCYFSSRLTKRCDTLQSMLNMISQMQIFIRYNRYRLSEILKRVEREHCDFVTDRLVKTADSGQALDDEWHKCVSSLECIADNDAEVLNTLGEGIGKSDTDGQLAILELAEKRLNTCLEQAESERLSKGRLFRTLGILLGAAVGIVAL